MALIRNYRLSDRHAVEKINYDTAFVGDSLQGIFNNRKLWATFGTSYYLDKEPESCFVLEDKSKVVGYIFGCLNDKNEHNSASLWQIVKAYVTGSAMERYVFRYYLSQMKKEMPLVPKDAGHLHINILPVYRKKGYGRQLLRKWVAYAKKKGVKTVHAEIILCSKSRVQHLLHSEKFKEYDRKKNTFWKHQLPNETMYCVCFVKKL